MSDVETKALELWNTERALFGCSLWTLDGVRGDTAFRAICRALEAHEAYKREVSEKVEKAIDTLIYQPTHYRQVKEILSPHILPKPDPLVEVENAALEKASKDGATASDLTLHRLAYDYLRAALAARNLEIVEKDRSDGR